MGPGPVRSHGGEVEAPDELRQACAKKRESCGAFDLARVVGRPNVSAEVSVHHWYAFIQDRFL